MKIKCPGCKSEINNWGGKCPICKFTIQNIHGFDAWAPELTKADTGIFFDIANFKKLASLEEVSFWFLSRNELILWALGKYFSKFKYFMEIGCGTGFVLRAIEERFPAANLVGAELYVEGLKFAAQRCTGVRLIQMDARKIPYKQQFDVVGIFDVLEHIYEDELVLHSIGECVLPGGGLVITIPQHAWLWSSVDVAACHVRRYSAKEIEGKVVLAGFEIILSTSFVSFLLPAMFLARFMGRQPEAEAQAELSINRYLNWIFRKIMKFEMALIRLGIHFPIGGSRLIVARRNVIDPV